MGTILIVAFCIAVVVLLAKIVSRGPAPPKRGNDLILCHSCNRPRRADSVSCPHCKAGPGHKKCVACLEWIHADATKCKHCAEPQPSTPALPERR